MGIGKHGGSKSKFIGKVKSSGRHSAAAKKAADKKGRNTLRDAKYVPGAKGGNGREA